MYADLQGKIALVTGAGRRGGLGLAIAARLASEGASVMIHDIAAAPGVANVGTVDELAEAAGEIRAAGGVADFHAADLVDEVQVRGLIDATVERFGRIDILVNNAGVGFKFGPLLEMSAEDWDLVLDVNLRGTFFAIKYAATQMIAQPEQEGWGRGRIISIGSRASKSGSAWAGAYSASKHGLVGLTRSLAHELSPKGITVNAVCPNHVTTKLGAWQNDFMAKAKGQTVDDYLAEMRSRIPLGRVGEVSDTANACAFLASGQASYITGEAMNVSGGEEYH
jgi:NAD(P)-dependent dehydrogenase (short-subunit alcohol dehydrogenase family)